MMPMLNEYAANDLGSGMPPLTSPDLEPSVPQWYAAYTWSRHEKSVAKQLEERRVVSFLPLYRSWHRWKDRRQEVTLPLFPSYVFVHMTLAERLRVLELPGVVAIDKYMYLNVNTPILEDTIRVQYSRTEVVRHVDDVQHTLAREALRFFHVDDGIEIVSMADVPAGTGLGSSSCYLVGLLNAMHTLTQSPTSSERLADEACRIELEVLKKPIGKQDQYMAALGGLTVLEIARDGGVTATRLCLSTDLVEALENNLLLFYTGAARDAISILEKQDSATKNKKNNVVGSLLEIKDIGIEIRDAIVHGNLRRFGELLDIHWQTKKRLSNGISTRQIDEWYALAKQNGALGGKVCGAGGGGFLMLYCEDKKALLRETMRQAGLRELNFRFEFEGSKVVFDMLSRDGRLAHTHRQERSHHVRMAAAAAMAAHA
jgi:D-glycero-alpha-D-manno-heptose-7-phosphate kinase